MAARAGYLLTTPDSAISVWFRAGTSFYSAHGDKDDDDDDLLAYDQRGPIINLDPMLVFSPVENVGLMFGPVLDVEVAGEVEQYTRSEGDSRLADLTEVSTSGVNVGVTAGIALLL